MGSMREICVRVTQRGAMRAEGCQELVVILQKEVAVGGLESVKCIDQGACAH